MKSFVANGPLSVDIDDFKMNVKKTVSLTTSPTKITKEISGSFLVPYKRCDGNKIALDKNTCIVSGKES